jgi:GDP-L-fucose synthase
MSVVNSNMSTLTVVTGGSGLVGSCLQEIMPNAVYLSSDDYDLRSEDDVGKLFYHLKPACIIHLAARVGGILDNIEHPAEYYTDNILMNTNLLRYAMLTKTPRFVGILSSCIFPGKATVYPMAEEQLHDGPPTPTNFSYAYAKRAMAVQIDAYNTQYNTNYNYIIPCNLYGDGDKTDPTKSHFLTALLTKIRKALDNGDSTIILMGDGTPLRQFMYAGDLARLIKLMIYTDTYENVNIAPPNQNLSINEMVVIALKALNAEHLEVRYDTSMPNGQHRKDIDSSKLMSLFPEFEFTPLEEGIKKVYEQLK